MGELVDTSNWPLPAQGVRFVTPPRLRRAMARNPLSRSCYPLALGFYPEAVGHRMRRTDPEDDLLIYCKSGSGWLETEDGRFEVLAGDLLVLPHGRPHAYGADPQRPWTLYWVHCAGEQVSDFLRPLGAGVRHVGVQPRLLADFDALLALRRQGLSQPHFVHAALQWQCLLSALALQPVQRRQLRGRPLDIEAVQAHMRTHLHEVLNLDELAAAFSLSRFHFAKRYRALTGQAPIEAFIQMKMAHACRLLDESAAEVRQVAEQLGYADPYYFSRLFRKVVGVAPSRYRALHNG